MLFGAKEPRVTAQNAAKFPARVFSNETRVHVILMATSVSRQLKIFCERLLWFEHPESSYLREVAMVEGGHLAATF